MVPNTRKTSKKEGWNEQMRSQKNVDAVYLWHITQE